MDWPKGTYEGRLSCDGLGNLLADEVDHPYRGFGVYHDLETNTYRFVPKGGPSHNQLHHKQFLTIDGTRDADLLKRIGGNPDDANASIDENPHHFEVQEDDAHYNPDAINNTRPQFHPEAAANIVSSHTAAYTGGDE